MHRKVYAAVADTEVVGLFHPLRLLFRSEWVGSECRDDEAWSVHYPWGVIHGEFNEVRAKAGQGVCPFILGAWHEMDLEVQFLHRYGSASDHQVKVIVHIRQIQVICVYGEHPVSEESVHLLAAMEYCVCLLLYS